jgi:hypothetical protein
MAGANGLKDCTWDSAACAHIRFGSLKVALTKFSPSKVDVKVEKVRRIGAAIADKRTPGIVEIGDATIELLTTDYELQILPRMPIHDGTMVEFVITTSLYHPSVIGSFGSVLDQVRIIGEEGPELDGSEKGLITKLSISVMNVFRKARDGQLKSLARMPGLPSSQAIAALAF